MNVINSDELSKERPHLVIVGTGRSSMSLSALDAFKKLVDAGQAITIEGPRDTAPVNDSLNELEHKVKQMNPNAHEMLFIDDPKIDDWDNEPCQPPENDYNDGRKERFGNNKFKPTKEHKRKIKKLAGKAKQKQRRLKGK